MRQILIVDSDLSKYDILRSEIEELLTVEITTATDCESALSILSFLHELDFIIVNPSFDKAQSLIGIEKYLSEEKSKVPVLIFQSFHSTRKETRKVNVNLDSNEFLEIIKEIFLENDKLRNINNSPFYMPVDFSYIEENPNIAFSVDFYLRIKQNAEDYTYIKRFLANDKFSNEEIEKLKKFKVSHIYVLKNQYDIFLKQNVLLILNKQQSFKNPLVSQGHIFHLSKEIINLIGIDSETEEIVRTNVKNIETSIENNESLNHYFKALNSNPNSFSYISSALTALVLTKLVGKFDWDSRLIKEKISYIAFFHDISIVDEKLCRVHSDEELYLEEGVDYEFLNTSRIKDRILKAHEIEQVQFHALNSALILEKIPNVPIGVFQVVKEHHGAKNGIGFNNSQSITLQPLSMLYLIVEDFVDGVLKIETPSREDIQNICMGLQKKYTKGNYKKGVEALIQICLPK